MQATNELYKLKADKFVDRESWQFALESLVMLTAPFAPHIAEELWHVLGHQDSIHIDNWPVFDEKYIVSDQITIVVQVNGKVEKVEGDLMQISLGTDHGVLKNNTLDVYRLSPEPKYLGMVRIVDANLHHSVARLVPVGNAQFRTPLRVGDLVTSKLTK